MPKSSNIATGKLGEAKAKEYLEKQGYKILATNWHFSRNAEIDIIAKEKDTLVFVEVKTRTTESFGHPLEAIDQRKIQKIYMAALSYIECEKPKHKNYRIDAISVLGKDYKIEHIKNIGLDW